MTPAELIALARRTPLTRGPIADLAKKVSPGAAREAATLALDTAGVHPAMVLAFVAASAGDALPPPLTRALLPEVATLDHVGPLAYATEGGPLDVLVGFLEDKRGDLELECLVMLLAAEACGADRTAPKTMLTRGRWLARHQLVPEASVLLGGAALRLHDPDLTSLSAPHVRRARRGKKAIDDTLDAARARPLEALADVDGARLSSGFTVRHEAPAVGRNDPCPCGSGKKYKKCHALAESAPASTDDPPKLDPRALGPDQTAVLRPSEIAALETSQLSAKAFSEAFRRVVDFRNWDLALRMIGETKGRKDLADQVRGAPDATTSFVLDALHGAYDAGDRAAAEKLHALLPAAIADRQRFALECLRAPADLLARIEQEADSALRHDADGSGGIVLADALLRAFPALGIYVARGALHEGRTGDSQALLEQIEDARDRLLLSPYEAWWDVYDAFFENQDERRDQAKDETKREKMKAELRRARAASRKTAAEVERLQHRVAELDLSLSAAPAAPRTKATAESAPAGLAEERRRLKTKIDELQRIIGEGQEERRDLRQKLADREEEEAPMKAPREAPHDEPAAAAEALLERGEPELPRGVLVPRYGGRAAKALSELAADAADGVLSVVAALAAGKPNAWGGVKQLAKVRGVLSARAGIHHRVLFSIADGSLDVLEVLHRRDLEQVVARLARVT